MRIYLNDNWLFTEGFKEEYLHEIKKEELRRIRVPHTVKEIPLNYVNNELYQMISTYYTELNLSRFEEKECFLVFEGNAHYSEVYINGELISVHKTGYTGFKVPIEERHKKDKTSILVKLDSHESLNIPPFGNVIDYLTYGGIYRDTYLEVKNNSFIEDVFVKVDRERCLRLEVKYHKAKENQRLRVKIQNIEEEMELREKYEFQDVKVNLWSVDSPNLYPLTISLLDEGVVIDEFQSMVGFRTISSDLHGIYLNGEKIKIRGLNRHQSYAYVLCDAGESRKKRCKNFKIRIGIKCCKNQSLSKQS